ncbi:MAG: ABC transporter permease, partial [Acidobacteria bacterium]|nr:ABC transporter permease [Acidobacteriota bacterium]
MSAARRWWHRLRDTFSTRAERELDQEFQSHLQMQIDDHVRAGMTPSAARRAALIAAGGLEGAKEAVRDRGRLRWVNELARDARYGVRFLRRSPAFAAAAVLSLALGIGANTAIFSILDSLMLKSLPVSDPQRLARITATGERQNFTNPLWEQLRARPELAQGLAAFGTSPFNLAETGPADRVAGLWVSGRFFDVMGVRPLLGRVITEADDQRTGGPDGPVAVINERFWRARFNGDPAVLGRRLTLDHATFTIVGVTPASFFGPTVGSRFDVAVPINSEPRIRGEHSSLDERSHWWLRVMARLRTDQTLDQLSAALAAARPAMREATLPNRWRPEDLPNYLKEPGKAVAAADGGPSYLRTQYRDALMAVMVVVAFVLLIACVNIANLLLARADARTHELSVRLALGASRGRLVRQLLVESLLLSAAGGVLALVFAQWSSRLLVQQFSTYADPIKIDLMLDWRVLAFTAAVAGVVTMVFGLAPALRATRVQPTDALKERGRSAPGHARWGIASALVVLQVALCLTLVIAAGLFTRTFTSLSARALGFDHTRVLHINLEMPPSDQRSNAARIERYARARAAAAAVPGVRGVALSVLTPFSGFQWNTVIDNPPGMSLPEDQREVDLNFVSPGWFDAVGTRRVSGRDIAPGSTAPGPEDVVVNEAFARKLLPGRNPVGAVVHEVVGPGRVSSDLTIVGVVQDALYDSIRDAAPPTMYRPLERVDQAATSMVLNVRMPDQPS